MRIGMGELAMGEQRARLFKLRHHGLVGIAVLALPVQHEASGKERHVVIIGAFLIHRFRDALVAEILYPEHVVVLTMPRRGVDEAGTGLFRHMVARQQRHVELIALPAERVRADHALQHGRFDMVLAFPRLHLRRLEDLGRQRIGQHDLFADLRRRAFIHRVDAVKAVVDLVGIGDGAVARDGPGRRRPDDDRRAVQFGRRRNDGEAHPDRRRDVIGIFDFGFGQRGLFDDRPHDGLGAAIERAVHQEFLELAHDHRFGVIGHGEVGIIPIALHAETLEFLALHIHPLLSELAAFAAEFERRHLVLVLALLAVLLLDLPFDGKAVAVPAGHVGGVLAHHLLRADDDVLQRLVEGMADMDVAIGVGRAVVKGEGLAALGFFPQALVEVHLLPAGEPFRLALGQARLHGEVGLGQEERLAIVAAGFFGVGGIGFRFR